jgi:hypothetical protein
MGKEKSENIKCNLPNFMRINKYLLKYIKRIFITVIDYGKRKERENIKYNLPNFMRINKYKS